MRITAEILGANIRERRKSAGLTQEELAVRLNVSFQTVSKWERGISAPDTLLLPLLAEIFSCSTDELFSNNSKKAINNVYYSVPSEFLLLWQIVQSERFDTKKRGEDKEDVQIIVTISPSGETVHMIKNDIKAPEAEKQALCDMAKTNGRIDRLVCMWQSGGVDVPSYNFRRGLIELNPENSNVRILLMGKDGFIVRTLGSTMP